MQNQIPKNWQKDNLENLLDILIDHRGITPKKLGGDWSISGISALSAKNIKAGRIVNEQDIRFVNPKLYEKWMPEKLEDGDILLTSEAPLGELYFLKEKRDYVLSQRLFALRTNRKKLNSRYLYYYLQGSIGRQELMKRLSGTAAEGIRQAELRKINVAFPEEILEQEKIASVISAFDDKIEVNNKIAKTLEGMAQALFKEWFIKFRFPGNEKAEFVDSEHGKIPKGWEVKRWKELEGESYAGDWGDEKQNEEATENVYILRGTDIPALKSGSKGDCPIRFLSKESLKKRKLKPGDIVIEISGGSKGQPTGRSIFITEKILERFEYPLVHTSFCRLVRANNILDSIFVYLHLDRLYRSKAIWNYQLQSTGISNFQYGHFRESEYLVVPSMGVQKDLASLLRKCVEYGQSNENQKLAALRDLLLPKLMRGEVGV